MEEEGQAKKKEENARAAAHRSGFGSLVAGGCEETRSVWYVPIFGGTWASEAVDKYNYCQGNEYIAVSHWASPSLLPRNKPGDP